MYKPKKTVKAADFPLEQVEASVATIAAPVVAVPLKPVLTNDQKRILESREVLKHPKSAGQKFFESPEGHIIVGESAAESIWCAESNNGKGAFINPRR